MPPPDGSGGGGPPAPTPGQPDDASEVDALLPKSAAPPQPAKPKPKRASPEAVARLRGRARMMYATRFGQQGVCLSYLGIFLVNQGVSLFKVGVIYTMLMCAMMLGSFTLPALADLYQKHRLLALCSHVVGTLSFFCLMFVGEHWLLSALLIAFGSFWNGGYGPLVDAAVFQLCAQHGCNFGELRLWGCVSWGLSVLLTSTLMDATNRIDTMWWTFLALSPFTFAATNALMRAVYESGGGPRKPPPKKGGGQTESQTDSVLRLLKQPLHTPLMIGVFATGMLFATLNTYVYIWMKEVLGAQYTVIGVAFLALNICEIPCFLYSTKVHAVIGVHGVMYVSAAAYAIRLIAYAFFVNNAWWTVLFEPMHALTFSLPIGTLGAFTTILADEARAPRATAQGIRQGTLNAGRALGFLLSAYLYARYSADVLFATMAFTAVPILFVSVFALHGTAYYQQHLDLLTKRPGRPPR